MSQPIDLAERLRDPQQVAADPTLSAFVTANAGSGKTKTLIDRVARLLLAGARPETILCVTYTKAAASEMQRRLFDVLGDWSILSDAALQDVLRRLEDRAFDAAELSRARTLFAQALETPGGLKIQTIHAFCEKLLRRFPLEAGVSPSFRVMDDAASAVIAREARGLVARNALAGGGVAEAYARFSVALDFQSFEAMFADFEGRRQALAAFFDREGGLAGAEAWIWRAVDVPRGSNPESLAAEAMATLDRNLWRRAAETLQRGTATDQKCAAQLSAVAADPAATFEAALAALFTEKGEGDAAKWVGKTSGLKSDEGLRVMLLAEQARLDAARTRLRAAQIAWDTLDALTLAFAYLAAYGIEKRARGGLDFADLIEKARDLLRDRPAAAWVLYKLDGGIDHILLDEAQDTAPDQWKIIDALSQEFFSGAGVGGETRRRELFVVGDEKQSIYSFQGAQPEQLLEQYHRQRERAEGAGRRLERVDLLTSWRSTPQILSFVDAVFGRLAWEVSHEVAEPRKTHLGCVDVWPLEVDRKADERDAWDAPLDVESEQSANRRLAQNIAREIDALIKRGDAVYDKATRAWRPAHAGDVLILVRRRRALFEEIIRALKRAEIPVAGADRLALSAHIAFDDLVALARFVLFPDDDLTLAALLKSPFCGLTDESLYALAHGRDASLWRRLQTRADEDAGWRAAADFLTLARAEAARRRPYEFYTVLLAGPGPDGRSMRQRILVRLGAEADEALDEFLGQVLAAERRGVHDLETLTADLAGLDIVIKREMEGERREVRVMTTHGAKGLEAPIVFLPETTLTQTARGSSLLTVKPDSMDSGFLWCGASARDCEATALAREARTARDEAEAYRLLYVALTRARDRLVLCGRIAERTDPDKLKGWWGAIRDGLTEARIADKVRMAESAGLQFQRFGETPGILPREAEIVTPVAPLPAWSRMVAAPEAFARYASPSDLGEGAATPSPSPLAASGGLGRFRRGDLIHRLLQLLPDLAPDARPDGARALLAREADLTEAQRAEMAAAALSVLEDPRFSEVFGPGSRPEVAVAGGAGRLPPGLRISGRIDRLVVLTDRVMVVDFKTNRPSPDRIEDADPAYLRQMALYAAVLADIFPAHRIEAAIVWTDGPKLMPIPEKLLSQALAELSARP